MRWAMIRSRGEAQGATEFISARTLSTLRPARAAHFPLAPATERAGYN